MNVFHDITLVKILFKSRFIKNTEWIVFARIIQMVLAFVISLITARYLGPSNFGILNYTQSFVMFFIPICTLGLNSIIVKEILDRPNNVGQTLGTMIGLRLLSSLASMGCILILVYFLNNNSLIVWVTFLQSFMLFFQCFDCINYWYQSKLFSKRTAFISLIGYLTMSLYRVVMLILHKDVAWFAFAVSLDHLVIAILLCCYYFKDGGQKLSFSWFLGKNMLGKSYHLILSGVMAVIYSQMDRIMLGKMIGDSSVGYYSITLSLCNTWSFILAAIIVIVNLWIRPYALAWLPNLPARAVTTLIALLLMSPFLTGLIGRNTIPTASIKSAITKIPGASKLKTVQQITSPFAQKITIFCRQKGIFKKSKKAAPKSRSTAQKHIFMMPQNLKTVIKENTDTVKDSVINIISKDKISQIYTQLWFTNKSNRPSLLILTSIRLLFVSFFIVTAVHMFLTENPKFIFLMLLLSVWLLTHSKWLLKQYIKIENRFLDNLHGDIDVDKEK